MTYRIVLPEDADVQASLRNFKMLEEEEPQLHIVWNERLGEIHAKLMGEVQIDVLKRLIWDRFGMAVQFDTGSIVYKETIEWDARFAIICPMPAATYMASIIFSSGTSYSR